MTHKKAWREILVVMRTYGINSSTNKNQNTINEWSNMYKVELMLFSNIYEYSKDIDIKSFLRRYHFFNSNYVWYSSFWPEMSFTTPQKMMLVFVK